MPKNQPRRKLVGMTPAAQQEYARFSKKLEAAKTRVAKTTALTILVWGPSTKGKSAAAKKRRQIRDRLRDIGHNALFSEEITSADGRSLSSQEFEQAEVAHLIIALVEGEGVSAEVADFCNHPRLFQKILVMIPTEQKDGYFTKGPISNLDAATGGGGVYRYQAGELTSCQVLTKALERAEGVRNIYYRYQRGAHFDGK